MKIVTVEFSAEVKNLLKEIFGGEDFPHFFEGYTDDYLFHVLKYIAIKRRADVNGEFLKEIRRLAVDAHNAVHYSIQLDSDRHPIDED